MSNTLKTLVSLVLLTLSGFMIWKVISGKKIKTNDDLKKEYRYTCGYLLNIANAIEKNLSELGEVPQVNSINELKKYVERYEKFCPVKDVWGNELLYQAKDNISYVLASAGSDGVFNGFDQMGKYSELNGEDIIIENGSWKFAPQDAKYSME
jgi:hypothetical protein